MATNTWVGVTDTAWGATPGAVSLNWSTGLVPTIADDVVIDATAPGDVVMGANAQCKSLDLTGFVGAFDMGGFELRHEGDFNISAFATYPNNGTLKTGTTCTITPHGKIFKRLTINALTVPAVVTIDGNMTLTDRLVFLNNIANELALLGTFDITATVDGAGIYCLDNSIISSDDVSSHFVTFAPMAGSVANYIKGPSTYIPLAIAGTDGVILLDSDGSAASLKVHSFVQSGSVLDFNGMDLIAHQFITLVNDVGFPAEWTNLGGRTVTVESTGTPTYRFTAANNFIFTANSAWFIVLPNDTAHPAVIFGGSIDHCDASDSLMDVYCNQDVIDAGNNSPEVLFGPHTTVDNVSSTNANATYGVGDNLNITVHFTGLFSGDLTVTGTPDIALELHPVRKAPYLSKSGATLTFRRVIASPDQATDLDYRSINSLSLQGGAITDAIGDDVRLVLPAPGAAGSIGANKAIVVATPGIPGGAVADRGFGRGWGFGL